MTRLVLIAACAIACGGKTSGSRVVDTEELANLADCKILERVTGTSSGEGQAAANRAKDEARRRAASLGATHVRWIVPCCTSVEGDAYRCDVPE
jgi:hypothetical protein